MEAMETETTIIVIFIGIFRLSVIVTVNVSNIIISVIIIIVVHAILSQNYSKC